MLALLFPQQLAGRPASPPGHQAWLCSTGSKRSKPGWLPQCPGHRLPNRTPPSRRRWCQAFGKHWPRSEMQLPVFKSSVFNEYPLAHCVDTCGWMHYVLHPLLATFMSRKFRYTLTTKSQICQCHSQNAFTPIPPVPAEKVTRHLLFLICAWSASIVACCIHEGHARAHCSKERNDQSQHPENDANGTNHLRSWRLVRNQNALPLEHLASFSISATQSSKPGDTSHESAPEILPAFPYCFKTPQHKGSDIRTITRIPTTIPPMEPPHSDAAYASSLQSTDMGGAALTWKVRDYQTQSQTPSCLWGIFHSLSWGPNGALSLMKSVFPLFRNIKLESANSYRHALLQWLRSPKCDPRI